MAKNSTSGKFYQDRKNGPWRIDTRVKINGKYYHIEKRGFATKHEAQAAYDSIIEAKAEAVNRAEGKTESVMLFEQFAEEFAKYRSKKVCTSTTSGNDFYLMKKYFHPAFDGKPVSLAFDQKTFLPWYEDLAGNTTISEARRNKAIRLAKAMLTFAHRNNYIDENACHDYHLDSIKEPYRQPKEHVLWSEAQTASFLAAIGSENPDFVMFSLFLETAPRIGEFLGLTADCFSYEQRHITIKQQIVYETGGKWTLTNRLKSHNSYRDFGLSESLANLLQRYITALGLKEGDFLFGPWGGHSAPLSRTEFRRKLEAYCKKAGVPTPNPHAFRHMLSTKLSRNCTNIAELETVAAMMGHSPSMATETYHHNNTPEMARRVLERSNREA